jgi:thiamine kinase-like enzyme
VAHTDLHRHNILVAGGQARLIDWAWPTLAAPWVDTACAGLQLIVAGHDPAAAEAWCRQSPAYQAASPAAVTAFTDAARAMWQEIAAQGRHPWTPGVAAAAARWASRRPR